MARGGAERREKHYMSALASMIKTQKEGEKATRFIIRTYGDKDDDKRVIDVNPMRFPTRWYYIFAGLRRRICL